MILRGCFLVSLSFIGTIVTEECHDELIWTTEKGQITVNGQPLVLKGINYFGFETDTFAPHGLLKNSLDFYLDFIKSHDFNAIRVPFSMEMIRYNPKVHDVSCQYEPEVCNATATRLLDVFIHRAAERGLLIMLDYHRMSAGYYYHPLWYDDKYSEKDVVESWRLLTNRYKHQWNVFAIDLKTDNHNADKTLPQATWGHSSRKTDWNWAAERMIKNLSDFSGLFFVGGIEWGNRYDKGSQEPIETGNAALNQRVVYSPHSFGPDAYDRPEYQKKDFPENLDAFYTQRYRFLADDGYTVVVGEWGGGAKNGTRDEVWNKWYVEWLRGKCMTNNFYWCLNPTTRDLMGGVFDSDWKTPLAHKLAFVNRLQPNPTKFEARDGKICITKGTFPEPHCQVPTVREGSGNPAQ